MSAVRFVPVWPSKGSQVLQALEASVTPPLAATVVRPNTERPLSGVLAPPDRLTFGERVLHRAVGYASLTVGPCLAGKRRLALAGR